MFDSVLVSYFLWFLVVLAILMYMVTAFKNDKSVDIHFFGTTKKVGLGKLLLITFVDGIVIGGLIIFMLRSTNL
jgi:uncharacterized integral membrane protein